MSSSANPVIAFHEGAILCQVSDTYPGLRRAVMEIIQNGLDADASVVYVGIDQHFGRVAVLDNGTGITEEKLESALGKIGQTQKSKQKPGTLGQFGLGLVAPVTKCKSVTILSCPKYGGPVNRWIFQHEAIRRQAKDIIIPFQQVDRLHDLPAPFAHAHNRAKALRTDRAVRWRTQVLLDGVSRDKEISRVEINELARDIRTKFGEAMLIKGATVYIEIREEGPSNEKPGKVHQKRVDPATFSGDRLPKVVIESADAGSVEFELYVSKKIAGKRQGDGVKVGEQGSVNYVSFADFRKQASGSGWYREDEVEIFQAFRALESGFFEGAIRASGINLHRERDKFVMNDALRGLYMVIAEWYANHGKKLFEGNQAELRDARYQQLGQESIEDLMNLIDNDPQLSLLFDDSMTLLPRARTSRPQSKNDPSIKKKRPPKGSHRPVVARPRQRTEGSDKSPVAAFISFEYCVMDDDLFWDYDPSTATIQLNVAHQLWSSIEDSKLSESVRNQRIKQVQEFIAFKLLLQFRYADIVEVMDDRKRIDDEVIGYILMFIINKRPRRTSPNK